MIQIIEDVDSFLLLDETKSQQFDYKGVISVNRKISGWCDNWRKIPMICRARGESRPNRCTRWSGVGTIN